MTTVPNALCAQTTDIDMPICHGFASQSVHNYGLET